MLQENPYLQYFCGYPGYDDEKLPFDPSLMVFFRKRRPRKSTGRRTYLS
ncbi:MAG: transposase [Anaerotignum faecicola]|nr:transposase [uncultured Anaerotignum sp.]